jgi:predicted dithiol-disulfide oxidoreductase (DUF899 family)
MPEQKVGTREEWLAARKELLTEEKELPRRSDALNATWQLLDRAPKGRGP